MPKTSPKILDMGALSLWRMPVQFARLIPLDRRPVVPDNHVDVHVTRRVDRREFRCEFPRFIERWDGRLVAIGKEIRDEQAAFAPLKRHAIASRLAHQPFRFSEFHAVGWCRPSLSFDRITVVEN